MFLKKSKIGTSQRRNLIIILAACSGFAATAFAEEATAGGEKQKNWLPNGTVSLTAGSATEYFTYSGKYLSLGSGLRFNLPAGIGCGVNQSFTKTWEPNEKLDAGDTGISFNYNKFAAAEKLQKLHLSIVPTLGVSLPVSKRSRDDKLQTRMSSAVSVSWSQAKLSLSAVPGYTRYFYAETLNAFGTANPKEQRLISLSIGYQLWKPVSVSYSYTPIERSYHEGFKKQYLFQTSAEVDYRASAQTPFFMGVASTNSQITGRERTKFVLYDKDVTEFYAGVGYNFR